MAFTQNKRKVSHFLTGTELSQDELQQVLSRAETFMRKDSSLTISAPALQGQTWVLLFEKPSLRTRLSFTVAIQELGGYPVEIVSHDTKKELPSDTIKVIQGYAHGMMIRTFDHKIVEEMAQSSQIPIINGLTDSHHPCQILADLLALKTAKSNLKGETITWIGDGNNVLHSLMLLAPMFGVNVKYACPRGYGPNAMILKRARDRAKKYSSAEITSYDSPIDAVRGTGAIYTDVWASMGQELHEAEKEKAFAGFQVSESLYHAAESTPFIMHCMPMNRGKEIESILVDGEQSLIFQQAQNRLFAQKALLTVLTHR